tara:strand:+ start:53 stop:2557 length:2505 start_codon:yes stop_codon:yes gene_type:complete
MAILTGTKPVNSGNAGWTQSDVLDALENAFADLQMHGGTAKTGVPIGVGCPNVKVVQNGYTEAYHEGWRHCGGRLLDGYTRYRYFDVKANGTTSYKMLEKLYVTDINSTTGESWSATGELKVTANSSFKTGDAVVWYPYGTVAGDDIAGLTQGQTYYVIRYSNIYVKLAASEADALAGTAIDLSASTDPTNGWGDQTVLRRPDVPGNENLTIETWQNDRLYFHLDASLPGNFFICSGDSYAADKIYKLDNAGNFPYNPYSTDDYPTGTGAAGTETIWDTDGSYQSEDELVDLGAAFGAPAADGEQYRFDGSNSIYGNNKIVEYCYANDTNATMKGVIKLLPSINSSNAVADMDPYWKYTVPGTDVGLASPANDLKLRIYRHSYTHGGSYDRGYISAISICSVTEGWTKDAAFTIPANAHSMSWVDPNAPADAIPDSIGSAATDIVFGVNTAETDTDAGDGKPNLIVTDFGATSTFFQKSDNGYHAILKVVNDSNKKYGTTYYSFSQPGNSQTGEMYSMMVQSGTYWDAFNSVGTSQKDNTNYNGGDAGTGSYAQEPGRFVGRTGQDVQSGHNTIPKNRDHRTYQDIARTQSTNSYPLEIRYYKDQSQDNNFAIIQFVQIINSIPYTHMTFTLPKGSNFGNPSPGMDLDYLYHGSLFRYNPSTSGINIYGNIPGYYYYYNNTNNPAHEPGTSGSKAMDSIYGYTRSPDQTGSTFTSRYACNIGVSNSTTSDHVIYYRNDEYDDTNALVNYYKPIKGIPIMSSFVPCPYYIPDDFVLIQVATPPGLTAFRVGDTITVSGSEKYVVIIAGYQQSQEGLNMIAGDTTLGMLFCGRVPN